jgi:hypothetical protein
MKTEHVIASKVSPSISAVIDDLRKQEGNTIVAPFYCEHGSGCEN